MNAPKVSELFASEFSAYYCNNLVFHGLEMFCALIALLMYAPMVSRLFEYWFSVYFSVYCYNFCDSAAVVLFFVLDLESFYTIY